LFTILYYAADILLFCVFYDLTPSVRREFRAVIQLVRTVFGLFLPNI